VICRKVNLSLILEALMAHIGSKVRSTAARAFATASANLKAAQEQGCDQAVPDGEKGQDSDIQSVLDHVSVMITRNQLAMAQRDLEEALDTFGQRADLLERLADVLILRGNREAAVTRLELAAATSPGDASILSGYADLLSRIGLQRRAIDFIESLRKTVRHAPSVRAALGDIYADGSWHALAVDAYGEAASLPVLSRTRRRRSWWRSGGPFTFVRLQIRLLDEEMRDTWLSFSANLAVLDTLDKPKGFTATLLKGALDSYFQNWANLLEGYNAIRRLTRRCLYVPIVAAAYLLSFIVLKTIHPRITTRDAALTAALSTMLAGVIWVALKVLDNITRTYRTSLIALSLSSLVLAGCGILLVRQVAAHSALAGALGVALVEGPCMAGCMTGPLLMIRFVQYVTIRNLQNNRVREAILDSLLDILEEMTAPDSKNNLYIRRQWMQRIDLAASRMEKVLPQLFPSGDDETDWWVSTRAKGAAAALRRANRNIAAPGPDTFDQLVAFFRSEAAALASGEMAALRWVSPRPPEARRKRWWRSALAVARAIVVMFVPLGVVLLAQPLLKFDTPFLEWAKVGGVGWAILCLLISVDPTVTDKITTAGNLIGAFKQEKPAGPTPDSE
jgi:hypothetical protein